MEPVTAARWNTVVRFALGTAIALLMVLPFVWMLTTAVRERGTVPPRTLQLLPDSFTLANFREVFHVLPFGTMALNSIIVASIAVPASVLVASWAGFTLLFLSSQLRSWLVGIVFVAAMIPTTAFWVTRFVLFGWINVIDSWWPLILPALTGMSPLFALVFLWSYRGIPMEMFEAARLDGAGPFRIWATIAVPLTLPTTVAVAMLVFRIVWNDFVDPLIYIQSMSKQTLPFALSALYQFAPTDWPLLMAATVILTTPVVALFLMGQRAFTNVHRGAGWLGN